MGSEMCIRDRIAMTALLAHRTDPELVGPGPQGHVGTMSSAPDGGTPIRITNKLS